MLGSLFNRVSIAIVAAVIGLAMIVGGALAWGGRIDGRPASFESGGTDGYYVWHDEGGLHLRTTNSAGVFEYSGTLRTNGTFSDLQLLKAEPDDSVTLQDGGKKVTFRFKTAQGIDGFDIQASDATRMILKRNGQRLGVANIFLGLKSVHPVRNPFLIRNRVTSPAATSATTPIATATSSQ